MKISVIIPVYNVEEHLEQCVSSVVNQQYTNLEIILVNDGSTDGSGAICDRLATQDFRIRVIHQQNAGVSSARNEGIAAACGDYLTFVDSDDWLSLEMYHVISRSILKENGPEVIMCDFINEWQGRSQAINAPIRKGYYNKNNIIRELYPTLLVTEDLGRIPIVSACTCLFQASLLKNNITFDPTLRYSEDYLFMAEVMIATNSFYYAKNQFFYHYRQYDESRSKKYQPEWWITLLSLNHKLKVLLAGCKDYDFTRQIKLQLIHSALFVSTAIFSNEGLTKERKTEQLKEVFNEPQLRQSFTGLSLAGQPFSLKIILFLVRQRMAGSYLRYRNLVQKLK